MNYARLEYKMSTMDLFYTIDYYIGYYLAREWEKFHCLKASDVFYKPKRNQYEHPFAKFIGRRR